MIQIKKKSNTFLIDFSWKIKSLRKMDLKIYLETILKNKIKT